MKITHEPVLGEIIGKLTVLHKNGSKWRCRCTCGKELNLSTASLQHRTSCGCDTKPSPISPGDQFDRLTAIRPTTGDYWLCRCECGTEKEYARYLLLTGKVKSCGCSKIKHSPQAEGIAFTALINPGDRFGCLNVVGKSEKGRWLCKCDCGNKVTVFAVDLLRGKAKSCGCAN